jgi:histidinol-phosphate aminotransferase
MKDITKRLVRKEIQALHAYHVADATGMIKLDAMENPYTWDDALVKEWQDELANVSVNRYPDPSAQQLAVQIRRQMALSDDIELMFGNGSDELIQIMAMAMAEPGRVVLAPEPSFVMYKMIATFCGMNYRGVPLAEDFSLDLPAMLQAIEETQPVLVFLAYPNNPTGNQWDRESIDQIIQASPGLVVVDEAYNAFASDSYLDDLNLYDNLVVMRTFSKMGLAGLRLGILFGSRDWLVEFDKVRLPYNINTLTQITAAFALRHQAVFDRQTAAICEERQGMLNALRQLPVRVFDSQANFILFRTADGLADRVFKGLKERNILIKNLNSAGGLLKDCLRVTVGKPEENQAFVTALKELL